jgi:hypothetical protein
MDPSEVRRYSDREFALILRTASETPEGPDPAPPRAGLTLSEIQEIAAEVGIDPQRVSRAAALLPRTTETTFVRLMGGHPRQRLEHTIPGTVPPEGMRRVVDVARRTLEAQGETREVLGALEWKGGSSVATVTVSIAPGEERTTLQASTDRTESAAGIYAGMGFPLAVVIAAALGKLVFGETGVGVAAAFFSALPPSLLLTRTLWKRSTKKWRERLSDLMDRMTKEAEAALDRRSPESGAGPRPNPEGGSTRSEDG